MTLLGFPVDGSTPSDAHNYNPDSHDANNNQGTGTGEDLTPGASAAGGSTASSASGTGGISKTVKYGAAAAALAGIAYKKKQ